MKPKQKKFEKKDRVWEPKLRASAFGDKRTKRERTRGAKFRKALQENQ